jgi:hypothetical protein
LPKDSVLVIGDTHFPFVKKGYLDFCLDIKHRVKCEQIVHIGDLCDNHAISYHEHDPNGRSPIDEMTEADKHLKEWFKAFPSLFYARLITTLLTAKHALRDFLTAYSVHLGIYGTYLRSGRMSLPLR